jgi:AraC family transcriptional regulator, exoenzyme S synthesis regulatory protein ExsA
MKFTVLPKNLKIDESENLQLYDYRRTEDIQKTKINLSKNTISFLRTGTKEVIGDDKTVQIGNEHFLIIKSGNCLMTEKVSDSFKVYRSILFFFSDEEILHFLEKYNQFSSNLKNHKSFYIFEYDNFVQNFVDSLEQILKLPKKIQSQILKNKFEELMLYLMHQDNADFLNSLVQNIDDKISRLNYIAENNKHNKLSLDELAFLCNMSVSTFKREFFKLYQMTPMKWFAEQRLNHVAFMLKTKKNRPIELYEDAGYENFSNFVQAFKRKFGMTPKEYQIQG